MILPIFLQSVSGAFTSTLIYLFFSVFLFKSLLSFAWILALVAQTVKCLPTMWESRVRSLGPEDPLQKEMVTHSRTLAWKIPWTEERGRLQSMGVTKRQTRLSDFTFFLSSLDSTCEAARGGHV